MSLWPLLVSFCWLLAAAGPAPAAEQPAGWPSEHIDLEALWFLHYGWGERDRQPFNQFRVSRGYTTIKFEPVDWFQTRSTVDLYEDDDGWELRFKYLYGRFQWPLETALISRPRLEFGLVHIPWLGFVEGINRYRAQGTMFLERNGLFNSADLGLTLDCLLGAPLAEAEAERIGAHYPGRWGSLSTGVYNGGGYHGGELNQDKVWMARASLRPLGPWLPGLQLSYLVVYGSANTEAEPDWRVHGGMASFQHRLFVLTAQAATGRGTQKGDRVGAGGDGQPFVGASGFAELRLPWIDSALFGRYDWFRWKTPAGRQATSRWIAGAAYYFYGASAVMLDVDWLQHLDAPRPDDWQVKLTLQVALP
jgi:hypothetical protein